MFRIMRLMTRASVWLCLLLAVFLFSIGVLRVDSTSATLQWTDTSSGWLCRVAQTNADSPPARWVISAAHWFGSPLVEQQTLADNNQHLAGP